MRTGYIVLIVLSGLTLICLLAFLVGFVGGTVNNIRLQNQGLTQDEISEKTSSKVLAYISAFAILLGIPLAIAFLIALVIVFAIGNTTNETESMLIGVTKNVIDLEKYLEKETDGRRREKIKRLLEKAILRQQVLQAKLQKKLGRNYTSSRYYNEYVLPYIQTNGGYSGVPRPAPSPETAGRERDERERDERERDERERDERERVEQLKAKTIEKLMKVDEIVNRYIENNSYDDRMIKSRIDEKIREINSIPDFSNKTRLSEILDSLKGFYYKRVELNIEFMKKKSRKFCSYANSSLKIVEDNPLDLGEEEFGVDNEIRRRISLIPRRINTLKISICEQYEDKPQNIETFEEIAIKYKEINSKVETLQKLYDSWASLTKYNGTNPDESLLG